MKRLAHSPLLRGNDATLLVDGDATFDSIFEGLAQAEHYALVQFYIIRDDGLGRRLKSALIDCANRGVKVFVLYDEVGSLGIPKSYLAELEAAGIQQSEFNTTQGAHNRFQLNFRNHRKNVVVDGKVTWIGGHNVGDEYLGLDPKVGHWRDTHVRIEGPAAQVAQAMFLGDWYWAKRTIPDLDWSPRPLRPAPTSWPWCCRSLRSTPSRPRSSSSCMPSTPLATGSGSPPPTSCPTRR